MSTLKQKPRPTTRPPDLAKMAGDPMLFFNSLVIATNAGPQRFGDVMDPRQREILTALAPSLVSLARGEQPAIGRFWIETCKGWGKSPLISMCTLWLACFASAPTYGQWAAADKDQAAEPQKVAQEILHYNPWLADRVDVQAWKVECESTGFLCDVVAADSAGAHGARPKLLAIDEIHVIQRTDFLLTLLDNAAKSGGLVICSTNAGFRDSEAFKLREIARSSGRWSFHSITEPPPWIDPEEVAEARQRNSAERFSRLFGGVWSDGAGDGLSAEDVEACVMHEDDLSNAREIDLRGYRWWAGADLGVRKDRSAFCIVGLRSASPNLRVALCKSWAPVPGRREVDLAEVERFILRANQKFRLESLTLDYHQAAYLQQRLSSKGVRCENVSFGPKSLADMASMILTLTKCRTLELNSSDEELIRDLKRITIIDTQWGQKVQSLSTADGHCDSASALIYAAMPAHKLTGRDESAPFAATGLHREPDGQSHGVMAVRPGVVSWSSMWRKVRNRDGWKPANW